MKLFLGYFLNFIYNDIITHIPFHALRIRFLRLFNKKINREAFILKHCRLIHFWNLEIAKNSIINESCVIDCRVHKVIIHENVDIGAYSKIWTLGHDPDDNSHCLKGGDVVINHHVWIATNVTILPDITIEKGAVVGASSVVTKNVDVKSIVAGNPAKHIRYRNNDLIYTLKYNPIFE